MRQVLPFPHDRDFAFVIPGKPQSWGIQLVKRGQHPGMHLDDKSEEYQRRVATASHLAARGRQISTACQVRYVLVFPRLKKHKRPERHLHSVAPDFDRVVRNINDGLQRCSAARKKPNTKPPGGWQGVLIDDALICGFAGECWYAAEGEEPHAEVTITPAV